MSELVGLEHALQSLSRALQPAEAAKIGQRVAPAAMADAAGVAAQSPGFPEWNATPELGVRNTATGAVVGAKGKGVGWWLVANVGRHVGVMAPPEPLRTKTGRLKKTKRWNGQTKGRGTFDQAARVIDERTLPRVVTEVDAIVRKALGV